MPSERGRWDLFYEGFARAVRGDGGARALAPVFKTRFDRRSLPLRLDGSEVAAKAFGEAVPFPLVTPARQAWAASNRVVTDWELRRSFELA